MPKQDKTEVQKRLFTIQDWIMEGMSSSAIIQQILAMQWAVSDRHAYRLLKHGRDQWRHFEEQDRDEKRKIKVQELKKRIRDMDSGYIGTPAGMLTILAYEKEIIKLEGLYFTTVHGKDTEKEKAPQLSIALTPAEIREISKVLEQQY